VLLTVAAPPSDAAALQAVTRELLERLALRVELRQVEHIELQEIRQPPPGSARYFARAWVGFAPDGRARLYLEHAATDRVLVRDVNDDAHNPELVREELGHILQSALEGLKAGEPIGAPRREALRDAGDDAPASAAPPVPPAPVVTAPPVQRSRAWRFGPRYELIWLGNGARVEDGPGAVLGVAAPGSRRFGLELGGYFRRPLRIDAQPIGARLQSWALVVLLSFEAWHGSSARLRLALGAQADLVRVTPVAAAGESVVLEHSRWLQVALGRLALTYAHDLGSKMDLELSLGAELDPSGTRYVIQSNQGQQPVLTPWPLRPLAALGVTVP
jgi:hypothetical protein